MRTLIELDTKANTLYENRAPAHQWLKEFRKDELLALWNYRCVYMVNNDNEVVITPEAYDDEVYDALYITGYFKARDEWLGL